MRTLLLFLIASCAFLAQTFTGVDYQINKAIKDKIYPGATLIVGKDGKVVYHKAYGNFTYDENSPKVDTNSIFDLASVTKVMATTQCVMHLYDKGKLDIEKPVAYYLPEFAANGKDSVKVKNLLMHTSGLRSYYSPQEGQTREDVLEAIYNLPLSYKTGSKMVYSCLNLITSMRVVEEITGMLMADYYKKVITKPLGLTRTMFNPPEELKEECMPTEGGLQGVVHDPLARSLEGLSGNAGLFSTTHDLSRILTLMLNKGKINGKRIFKESTVNEFTRIHDPKVSRGLGWDINQHGDKTCGPLFSRTSFGHNGYTGTSIWCDPVRDLYVVFLTNRVYPDDNASIGGVRRVVHDAVIMAMENIPPQPEIIEVKETDDSLEVVWNPRTYLGMVERAVLTVSDENGVVQRIDISPLQKSVNIFKNRNDYKLIKIENQAVKNTSVAANKFVLRGDDNEVLLVDGIDNNSSSTKPYNDALRVVADAIDNQYGVRTISNDLLAEKTDLLKKYKYVVWMVSEDNSLQETLNEQERELVKEYLKSGGNLVLSGSELVWTLGKNHSFTEGLDYLRNVLHVEYIADKSGSMELKGVKDTPFEGVACNYASSESLYEVGYPDAIAAAGKGSLVLEYANGRGAGVMVDGAVENNGKLFVFGFPIETVEGKDNLKKVFCNIFEAFND